SPRPIARGGGKGHDKLILSQLIGVHADEAVWDYPSIEDRVTHRRRPTEEAAIIQVVPPEKLPGEKERTEAVERPNPAGPVQGEHHHCPPCAIKPVVVRTQTPRDLYAQ